MITPFWPVKGRKSSIPFQRTATLRTVASVMNGSRSVAPSIALLPNHFRQSELDEFDFARLNPAELERLAELGGAGDALAHDGKLAALQVLEVLDGVGEIAANDDGGKAESLGNLTLVGHELHSDAAREGVEQGGSDGRTAHLHLAGCDRW